MIRKPNAEQKTFLDDPSEVIRVQFQKWNLRIERSFGKSVFPKKIVSQKMEHPNELIHLNKCFGTEIGGTTFFRPVLSR